MPFQLRTTLQLILFAAVSFGQICAQTPAAAAPPLPAVDQLAKPPASAQAFTILSVAGTHGKSFLWTAHDGTLMSRDSLLLRGQVFETDEAARLDPNGYLAADAIHGFTPSGNAAETF